MRSALLDSENVTDGELTTRINYLNLVVISKP
jgi:hypothetical protein